MLKEDVKWISLKECKHGGLYEIDARNFSFGVFDENQRGFIGIRLKFRYRFLDTEFHWDTGAPYGTAKPLKFIEMCPIELNGENKKLFDWLDDKI